MTDTVLKTLRFLSVMAPTFYLSYVVSKNYQTRRLVEISQHLGVNPESLSLVHNVLNTLPSLFSLLLADKIQVHGIFAGVADAMMTSMSLILGFIIYLSDRRYQMDYLLFTKSIVFSIASYFCLFFLFVYDNISWYLVSFSSVILVSFVYLSCMRSTSTFQCDDSVYVRIDDYSTRASRITGRVELMLNSILDVLCGSVPLLQTKDDKPISIFSLPLMTLGSYAVLGHLRYLRYMAAGTVLGLFVGIFVSAATRSGKRRFFTKLYGFLTSTYLIFLLSKVLERSFRPLDGDIGVVSRIMRPIVTSTCTHLGITISSVVFFSNNQIEMAYLTAINAYIPAVLMNTGPLGALLLLRNGHKVGDISGGTWETPTSVIYFPVLYLLILTNCEIWGYRIRKDLGFFLLLNFAFYVLCSVARVTSMDGLK